MQRILVIENLSLFGAGIQSLLMQEPNLEVFGINPNDEATLIQEINHIHPDVIVMDHASSLINIQRLQLLLGPRPCLRLVQVNVENDLISIHDNNQILIMQADDFVNAIQFPHFEIQ